jgi:molybdopterin adenylyltransferase
MKLIKAISISDRKGVRKKNIDSVLLMENFGLENDAHGGDWHRQVSFLAQESINFMREKGLDVVAGNFAENITTEGIDLVALKVGTHLQIGVTELVISQLGKICHNRCAIYHQAGDCVMPREGVFAVVRKGGEINVGDQIHVLNSISQSAALVATDEDEEIYGKLIRKKINETRVPAFIRFDSLSSKQSSLEAILKDLADTQHIDDIIIFDSSGGCGLALAGYEKAQAKADAYIRNGSIIYYFKTLEDFHRKSNFT